MSESEPSAEALAEESFTNLQNVARQLAFSDGSDIGGAMIAHFGPTGVHTTPYVHHEQDAREASLWLLGAFLAHMDESTPDGTHPLEMADHALALMDDYQDDPHVGWSTEHSVAGKPWEGNGDV